MRKKTRLGHALAYARRGWRVLPVNWTSGGRCSCGQAKCSSPGKHPFGLLAPHGRDNATTKETVIRQWWRKQPKANIAVATGRDSGLVVIDIDPRNGADRTLRHLEAEHGTFPKTVEVETGGGGRHLYFRFPHRRPEVRSKVLGNGVEMLADGKSVTAPGSIHASGKRYRWKSGHSPDDIELAALPQWMLKVASEKRKATRARPGGDKITAGARNDELMSYAGRLRRCGEDEERILLALMVFNENCCEPPLDDEEVAGIARSVAKYPVSDEAQDSQATRLVRLMEDAELFHAPDRRSYVAISIDGRTECWPLDSKEFEALLHLRFFESEGKSPGPQAISGATGTLTAKALFNGPEQPVHVRLAGHDGVIYVDLGDEQRRVLAVTAKGWSWASDPPVRFVRPSGFLALPEPVHGGRLNELEKFLNLGGADDWALVAAWLIAACRPVGPYPPLIVNGEQGSAKSTMCAVLRRLVDPNEAPLRAGPGKPAQRGRPEGRRNGPG